MYAQLFINSIHFHNSFVIKVSILFRQHILNLILILFLSFFAWNSVLDQTMTGEAPLYFYYPFFTENFQWGELHANDKGARIYFDITKRLFHDTFYLYQVLLLIIVIISALLFYLFVFALTQNKLISLTAAILYSVNFNGSFEMIAMGRQDMFVERMINTVIVFPSFAFFGIYRKYSKMKYYYLSVFLFLFSTFLAHFSIFFLPLLAGLVIIDTFKLKTLGKKILHLLLLLPYILGSGIMIYADSLRGFTHIGRDTFPRDFSSFEPILTNMIRQLTSITIPSAFLLEKHNFLQLKISEFSKYYLPVIMLYFSVIILVFRKSPKALRAIAFSSFLAILLVCILNLYMRWSITSSITPSSRYLFAISIPFSLFWAVIFYGLLYRNKLGKVLFYILLSGWIILNIKTIKFEISKEIWKHNTIKAVDIYVKQISYKLHDDSIVIVADALGYHGATKLQYFYGKKTMTFLPLFGLKPYPLKKQFKPGRDYLILYDSSKGQAVDKSKEYKEYLANF